MRAARLRDALATPETYRVILASPFVSDSPAHRHGKPKQIRKAAGQSA
jgi:hypothetical protein